VPSCRRAVVASCGAKRQSEALVRQAAAPRPSPPDCRLPAAGLARGARAAARPEIPSQPTRRPLHL